MGRELIKMSANDDSPRERGTAKERACPICGKPRDPRYDPFCSKRCADVDLHRWLKGNYVIPARSGARKPMTGVRAKSESADASRAAERH
jgi:endogenous inhibitor of DNA gyrase (YacG/DUF329 family)